MMNCRPGDAFVSNDVGPFTIWLLNGRNQRGFKRTVCGLLITFWAALPLTARGQESEVEKILPERDTLIEVENPPSPSPSPAPVPFSPRPSHADQLAPSKPHSDSSVVDPKENSIQHQSQGDRKKDLPTGKKTDRKSQEKSSQKKPSAMTAGLRYQIGVQGTRVSGDESLPVQDPMDSKVTKLTIRRPKPPVQGYIDLAFRPGRIFSSSLSLQLGAEDKVHTVEKATLQIFYPFYSVYGVGLALGRDRAPVGGFENETSEATGKPLSTYLEYRVPFRDQRDVRSVDGIKILSKSLVGEWNLQLMRDVSDTTYHNSRKSFNHDYQSEPKAKRPAFALEGRYEWSLSQSVHLIPLVQASAYDSVKSRYLGGGLKLKVDRFTQIVDGGQDRRALGRKVDESEAEPLEYQVTRFYTLESSYDFKNGLTPFLKLSQYLTTQGVNRKGVVMDAKGNQSPDLFDDQCLDFYSGLQWRSKLIQPFAWFHWQRQRVLSQPRNPYETVTVTAKSLEAGFSGVID